jgi:hypothetical protein
VRSASETLLLSINISTGGVNFIVSCSLEMIKSFVVFIKRGDSGSGSLILSEGHETHCKIADLVLLHEEISKLFASFNALFK